MKFGRTTTLLSLTTLVLTVLSAGCASERPSDITVDQLESRMVKAMDPQRRYRAAERYIQRQNITEKGFWSDRLYSVEIRYQRPDQYKFTIYEEKEAQSGMIYKAGKAWLINYNTGEIRPITGIDLEKLKIALALGQPDTDFDTLFKDVLISIVKLEDDREYYKLTCMTGLNGKKPFVIYVDRESAMTKRLEAYSRGADGEDELFTTDIVEYLLWDDVLVPILTKVTEGEREYSTRIIFYQLNPVFPADEFELPTFDKLELRMRQERRRHSRR